MDIDRITKRVAWSFEKEASDASKVGAIDWRMDPEEKRRLYAEELKKDFVNLRAELDLAIKELDAESKGKETNLRNTSRAVGTIGDTRWSEATEYFFT